jgi:lipid-A-disaccharide synthase
LPAERPQKLMFVAGENSGDLHAARLIVQLREMSPGIVCFGLGGDRMAAAGLRLDRNLAQDLPVIGFTQAIRKYPRLREVFHEATALLRREKPDALVLVDYPGFNLKLARAARDLGVPVVYYISPQVWAWNYQRVNTIRETVSLMLVILPFEEDLYRKEGVPAVFVGHPLLDDQEPVKPREETLARLGIPPGRRVIGIVPGSRHGEVVRHLPVMLEAAKLIRKQLPDTEYVMPRASTIAADLIAKYTDREPGVSVRIADDDPASVRAAMDFAICKSGTSTLEMALADVPMVIVYRVSEPTYLIAKMVVRIPWIGLVNVVANETVAPELLQHDANPPRIAREVAGFLENPGRLREAHAALARVRSKIGGEGASRRAAGEILSLLAQRLSATRG